MDAISIVSDIYIYSFYSGKCTAKPLAREQAPLLPKKSGMDLVGVQVVCYFS
jgi:hypothetical protein